MTEFETYCEHVDSIHALMKLESMRLHGGVSGYGSCDLWCKRCDGTGRDNHADECPKCEACSGRGYNYADEDGDRILDDEMDMSVFTEDCLYDHYANAEI